MEKIVGKLSHARVIREKFRKTFKETVKVEKISIFILEENKRKIMF